MSISMLVAALLGPRMAARRSPKRTAQVGLGALVARLVRPARDDRRDAEHTAVLASASRCSGIGAGLLVSQLGNVIMSSVPADRTNEAGGLQGTAQNLGASLGTALIGAVLLTGLTNGFVERVQDNPALPQRTEAALTEAASKGLDAVPVEQVEAAARRCRAAARPGDRGRRRLRRGRAGRAAERALRGRGVRRARVLARPAGCPGRPHVPEGAAEARRPRSHPRLARGVPARHPPAGRGSSTRGSARSSRTSASGGPTAASRGGRHALTASAAEPATRASGGRRTGSRGGSASSSRSARSASRSARSPASSSWSARPSTGSCSSSGRSSSRRPPRSSACRRSTRTATRRGRRPAVPPRRVRAAPDRLVEQRRPVRRHAALQRGHLPRDDDRVRQRRVQPARVDARRARLGLLPDLRLPRVRRGLRRLRVLAAPRSRVEDRGGQPARLHRLRHLGDRGATSCPRRAAPSISPLRTRSPPSAASASSSAPCCCCPRPPAHGTPTSATHPPPSGARSRRPP